MALAGCGTEAEGETTTTTTTNPTASEASGNPWDLPIEQRPPLFDPCAEIPTEAVEEGVGGLVEVVEEYARNRPGELVTCGWKNRQVHLTLLSTWKSRGEYLADPSFSIRDPDHRVDGRQSLQLTEVGDQTDSTCLQMFFTDFGAVWVKLDLVGGLSDFKNERLVEACDALEEAIVPLLPYIPEGDH